MWFKLRAPGRTLLLRHVDGTKSVHGAWTEIVRIRDVLSFPHTCQSFLETRRRTTRLGSLS